MYLIPGEVKGLKSGFFKNFQNHDRIIKEFWQIFVKYLIQRFVNEKNKDEIQVKNAQTDEDNNTRIMKALIIIRLRQAVCEQFILFETLLNDGFSTDRIIYDKIANIEAIK